MKKVFAFLFLYITISISLNGQPIKSKKIQQQLTAFLEEFMKAYNKPDAEALANLFTQDATYIGTAGDITKGKDKLIIGFKNSLSYLKDFSLIPADTGGDKNIVYQTGTYMQKLVVPNRPVDTYTGKYLIVLRKVSKNTWKIQKQMVSRDKPSS